MEEAGDDKRKKMWRRGLTRAPSRGKKKIAFEADTFSPEENNCEDAAFQKEGGMSGVAVSRTFGKTATFKVSRQRPFLQVYKLLSCQPSSANPEPKGSELPSDLLAVSPTIERLLIHIIVS